MPADSEVVSAMDADAEGRKLADVVRRAFEQSVRPDLHFALEEPLRGKDWNDQLRAKPQLALPLRAKEPSVA